MYYLFYPSKNSGQVLTKFFLLAKYAKNKFNQKKPVFWAFLKIFPEIKIL